MVGAGVKGRAEELEPHVNQVLVVPTLVSTLSDSEEVVKVSKNGVDCDNLFSQHGLRSLVERGSLLL